MKSKNNKLGSIIISLLIVVMFLLIISFVKIPQSEKKNELNLNTHYYFHINFISENISTDNYLIIPLPLYKNQSLIEILDLDLNFKERKYSIESTKFGIGLNISYKNGIHYSAGGVDYKELLTSNFSLLNKTALIYDSYNVVYEAYYWIYSTINGMLIYEFEVREGNLECIYNIETEIIEGWQIVKGIIIKRNNHLYN